MKRLIVHGIVMAALIIGLAACSSDTGSKPGAGTVAKAVQTCEAQPTNFEWSGHTYRLTQDNTDMEPMMKFGWLDCEAGRLVPADDDYEAFATLYSTGDPTDGKIIWIGETGRILYERDDTVK